MEGGGWRVEGGGWRVEGEGWSLFLVWNLFQTTSTYISCGKCKKKYSNDEEHVISTDFGYTRLEERFKTCKTCRAKHKNNK